VCQSVVYVCVPLTQAIRLNVDRLNHACVAVCVLQCTSCSVCQNVCVAVCVLQRACCNVRVAVCVRMYVHV